MVPAGDLRERRRRAGRVLPAGPRRRPSRSTAGTGSATPYTASIPLTGTFDLNGRDSQVYDVSVTLNYHDMNGNHGPMAAFVDLGKLMVYA